MKYKQTEIIILFLLVSIFSTQLFAGGEWYKTWNIGFERRRIYSYFHQSDRGPDCYQDPEQRTF